jgi:hypothetical protein
MTGAARVPVTPDQRGGLGSGKTATAQHLAAHGKQWLPHLTGQGTYGVGAIARKQGDRM